jgi:putative ABC transport system ATP-binding protein
VVRENDLVIIQGESGAGKSTILKLLNRFCDYTNGKILFNDRELKDFRVEELRRSIIYLPQLPVMKQATIEENLSFPYRFRVHEGKQFDLTEARKWLDYFQLELPVDTDVHTLSIGQRQRIALIRAMILLPEVLLLDEPLASLDKRNRLIIEQKIESLVRTAGLTVIMVTHGDVSSSLSESRILQVRDKTLTAVS